MAKIKIAVMTDIVDLFAGLSGRSVVDQEVRRGKTIRVLMRQAVVKEWENMDGDLDRWSVDQILYAFDRMDNDKFASFIKPNMKAAIFDDIGTFSVPKYVSFIVPIEFDTRAFMLSVDKREAV